MKIKITIKFIDIVVSSKYHNLGFYNSFKINYKNKIV